MATSLARKTRLVLIAATGVWLMASPLLAQDRPAGLRGLDPYNPTDAKILRELGPAIATQMAPEDLAKLDPYNPTDAALLRQSGGAIPLCCVIWPGPGPFIGTGSIVSYVSIARPEFHPAPDPNVVWVCRGASCTPEDVRTHRFSRPPTNGTSLPPSLPAEPVGPGR